MPVGPNKALRDETKKILDQLSPIYDELDVAYKLAVAKENPQDALNKLEVYRKKQYPLGDKLQELRKRAGQEEPFDPGLIKILDKAIDQSADNNSAEYYARGQAERQLEAQNRANKAMGETADNAATNSKPADTAGAGQQNNNPSPPPKSNETPLTDKETKKVDDAKKSETTVQGIQGGANPALTGGADRPPASEKKSAADNGKAVAAITDIMSAAGGSTGTPSSAQSNQTVPGSQLYNKLHDYNNYTYRITLFLLTAEDFVTLNADPDKFTPGYSLISSGGGYAADKTATSGPGRHPDFLEDFFIENLSLTTVVGLNARSKASNAIEISFSIVEPYGMSLLDRLLSACTVTCKNPNYIEQPFLLQVDFLANATEAKSGQDPILIDRKRIAIRIIEMKIKPGTGGTDYACRAIPYNHEAYQESVAAVPINISVEASTVGDYFDSASEVAVITGDTSNEERIEEALKKIQSTIPEITEEDLKRRREELKAQLLYTTASLPAGYNTYMKSITRPKGKAPFTHPPSLVLFNIHPDIAKATIVDPNKTDASKTKFSNRTGSLALSITQADASFKQKTVFNVHAGTDMVTLIGRVIETSSYIKDQLIQPKDQKVSTIEETKSSILDTIQRNPPSSSGGTNNQAEKPLDPNKFLKWYKITSQVLLKEFDPLSNNYSKIIVYSVMPYLNSNKYSSDFAKTQVSVKKCVRTYNYIYTGKNEDIISLDIDFDSAFYTGVTTLQKNQVRGNNYKGADTPLLDEQQEQTVNTSKPQNPPVSYKPIAQRPDAGLANSHMSAEDVAIAGASKSLYTSSRGDMLNIKLRIIGDPAWIKQDDIYYNPRQPEYPKSKVQTSNGGVNVPVNSSGQILFDEEQVFVQVLIKGAVDIDDTTGITNKNVKLSNGNYTNGTFSGVYAVMTVRSEFARGTFTQTLDMIRMPDDTVQSEATSNVTNKTAGGDKTSSSTGSKEATTNTVGPPGGTPFTPPRPEGVPAEDPKLKEAANQPASTPNPSTGGAGTPAPYTGPGSYTGPGNTDIYGNPKGEGKVTTPEEKAKYDAAVAINEDFTKRRIALQSEYDALGDRVQAERKAISSDTTLSDAEKAKKELEVRRAAQEELLKLKDKIRTLLVDDLNRAKANTVFPDVYDPLYLAKSTEDKARGALVDSFTAAFQRNVAKITALEKQVAGG